MTDEELWDEAEALAEMLGIPPDDEDQPTE